MNKKINVYVIEAENNKELVEMLEDRYYVCVGKPEVLVPKCEVIIVGKTRNWRVRTGHCK